jgi:hypothetical protein
MFNRQMLRHERGWTSVPSLSLSCLFLSEVLPLPLGGLVISFVLSSWNQQVRPGMQAGYASLTGDGLYVCSHTQHMAGGAVGRSLHAQNERDHSTADASAEGKVGASISAYAFARLLKRHRPL